MVYLARQLAHAHAPSSAIVDLIQGLYEHDSSQARRLVRSRIYATLQPTEMCRGMVKVAARRLTAPIVATPIIAALPAAAQSYTFVEFSARTVYSQAPAPAFPFPGTPVPTSDGEYMALASRLAATIPRDKLRYECDRPIAAVLVSESGELLAWGLNSNSRNKSLHAEVNMVQSHYQRTGRSLPRGARIYSTLKPCRMCAGMIWHCAEDVTQLKIYYNEFDAGPLARETILNPLERQLSPA